MASDSGQPPSQVENDSSLVGEGVQPSEERSVVPPIAPPPLPPSPFPLPPSPTVEVKDGAQHLAHNQEPALERLDTEKGIPAIFAVHTGSTMGRKRRHRTPKTDPFSLRGVRGRLVGRQKELDEMKAAAKESAADKKPVLLTVVGNQGTGKSRLVDEFLSELPNSTVVYRCHAVRDGSVCSTASRLLRDRFSVPDPQAEESMMERFQEEVQEVLGGDMSSEELHMLGQYLDLEFPETSFLQVLSDSPSQYQEISRTIWKRFVENDARMGPIALVVDDLQWADKTSLQMLQELSESLEGVAVVIVVAARTELKTQVPQWGKHTRHSHWIELRNLSNEDAASMFRENLKRCDRLPEDIVEDAVEMTAGNPHFIDQLIRLYLSNGTVDSSSAVWTLDPDKAMDTDLPISVEEVIEARISSLAIAEREVLEKGAVFGNVFWLGAIVALTRMEGSAVEGEGSHSSAGALEYNWQESGDPVRKGITEVVANLVERDYLLRLDDEDSTVAGDVEFVFKHNLERELIAKGTEGERLKRYHRLAAQWVETTSTARSEEQLEFLGLLYEHGGDLRRAANAYILGGDRARLRYANEQAVELYRKGLSLLDEDDAVVLLEVLHDLGSVLDLIGETKEAQLLFSRMLQHAWLLDHQAKGGAAHNRLGRIHRRLGEYDQAMAHLRSAQELFKSAKDNCGIAGTLDDIGQVHWLRGAYGQALSFHRQALAIRRGIGDTRSIALSLANIGRVHHETGAFKAAARQFREALELRREINDRSGVIQSLLDIGRVEVADGNYSVAMEKFLEAKDFAKAIGDRLVMTEVLSGLAECQSSAGENSDAIASLLEAKSIAHTLGNRPGVSDCYRRLAETYLSGGAFDQAMDCAKRALELGSEIRARLHIGRAHRVLAETTFGSGRSAQEVDAANAHFSKAVDILSGMKSEVELARTYRAYAVLREHIGNIEEAEKLRRRSDEIFGRLRGANQAAPAEEEQHVRLGTEPGLEGAE